MLYLTFCSRPRCCGQEGRRLLQEEGRRGRFPARQGSLRPVHASKGNKITYIWVLPFLSAIEIVDTVYLLDVHL